jgi:transposase
VVGAGDFAIRHGQHYGTLLIDIETGAPLDFIEGRDAQPLADWLAAHPGVEVICRNRSGSYADGARTGAPEAVQVADRFHLRQNLAKAVEKCAAAHRACLAGIGRRRAARPAGKSAERIRRHHALVHELRRGTRAPRDRPPPRLGPAHRPAARPRRHLAGTRRRPLEGTPA